MPSVPATESQRQWTLTMPISHDTEVSSIRNRADLPLRTLHYSDTIKCISNFRPLPCGYLHFPALRNRHRVFEILSKPYCHCKDVQNA